MLPMFPQNTPGRMPPLQQVLPGRPSRPNFPKEVREKIMADPSRLMQQAVMAGEFQRKHEQESIQRLKELLTHFNNNLKAMGPQLETLKKENVQIRGENENLKQQLQQQSTN
eukprot:PhF_6_TR23240/c1_g9_i3/m.32580